ncbi:MAG: hypothetical protein Q9187_004673 [Circinaria calcarea]
METNGHRVLTVGLAVGHGTGPELADIFERVILHLADPYSVHVQLRRPSRIYHSYLSLFSAGDNQENINKETMEDVEHYKRFCEEEAARGTRVIFRTAITAQSLYIVREDFEAIKIERFDQGQASILLVRDQAQGFYTGSNDVGEEVVSRTCYFSKGLFGRIVSYSLERARQLWGPDAIDSIAMVYKHHLFGGTFDGWAKQLSKQYAVKVEFIQPDTMNRNLLAFGIQGKRLIIAGNEYADIMQVILIDMFGKQVQETSYAENVYLHPKLHTLSEYQTVHGSADNLVGKGIVNPTATIKAAAAILERHAGCTGLEETLNSTLRTLLRRNATTPDQGGSLSTAEFVHAVLDSLTAKPSPSNGVLPLPTPSPLETRISMGKPTALLVIDFQNDFLLPLQKDSTTNQTQIETQTLIANLHRLITAFRTHNLEIIYLRFLGDCPAHQPPNWAHRDRLLARKPHCLEHTPGAAFHAPELVGPLPGERVFTKRALFDSFLAEGFERYLHARGYEHLVLAGLYADVCVDATARTAFQKGFYLSVVEDCTASLHLEGAVCLDLMRKVYGARVLRCEELMGMEV